MAEEQVLEYEVVPASEDLAEGREAEADKFEHPHRFVDPAARVLPPYSEVVALDRSTFDTDDVRPEGGRIIVLPVAPSLMP